MATQITATLPALDFPLEADYPTQEDWAAFSAAAELNFGILGGSWSTQMQLWKDQANAMSIELNNNADIAQSVANYQGDWVSQGYTLGQTVSVSGIYYVCKLTHATGQNPTDGGSLYWNLAIGNWNLKVNNYGNETIAGVKTFSSSPIVPTPTTDFQAATKKYVDSSALPIGTFLNGYTIFDNCIVAFGGEFNRADYPKLWAYLQANPTLVKTQAAWTTENTTNGMCGYYSSGNETTTFRVPNLDKAFLRPDSRTVGSFQEGSYAVGDSGGTTPAVDGLLNYDDNSTAFRSRMNWDAITTVSIGATNLRGAAATSTLGTFSYQSLPTEFGVTRPKNIAVLPLIVAK